MIKPSPRAGLAKAADADVHPTTPPNTDEGFLQRMGATTADAVGGPDRDRKVILKVEVPKSLRKSVRAEAKRRGMTVDEIVAEALRARPLR